MRDQLRTLVVNFVETRKPQDNFAIGDLAPDIHGEDLDEVAFSLSDYRGKVVVLDFWGDW